MSSGMIKSTIREIKGSLGRYMAIFAIVMLGVALFTGLKATTPAMIATENNYLAEQNFYDFRLLSTIGFQEEDVAALKEMEQTANAEGAVSTDAVCSFGDGNEPVYKFHTIPQSINQIVLTAGRMPQRPDECLLDDALYGTDKIGSQITVTKNNDADTLEMFQERTFTAVGIVRSPYYINFERGTTSVGEGKITAFLYVPKEAFACDYLTEIYVKTNQKYDVYTDAYEDYIDSLQEKMEAKTESLVLQWYNDITSDAQAEIDDAQAELNEKMADAKAELADARQKIADGEKEIQENEKEWHKGVQEIADGEKEIADNEQNMIDNERKLNDGEREIRQKEQELLNAETQIRENEQEIAANEQALASGKDELKKATIELRSQEAKLKKQETKLKDKEAELKKQETELQTKKTELAMQETELVSQEAELKKQETELVAKKAELSAQETELVNQETKLAEQETELTSKQTELNKQKNQLEQTYASQQISATQYEAQRNDIQAGLQQIKTSLAELAAGRQQLQESLSQIHTGSEQIQNGLVQVQSGLGQVQNGLAQVRDGLTQLQNGQKQLQTGKQQIQAGKKEIQSGKQQLAAAKNELAKNKTLLLSSEKELLNGKAEITKARGQLSDGRQQLADGKAELQTAKAELEDGRQQITQAKKELEDARKKLEKGQKKLKKGKSELADARKDYQKAYAEFKSETADAQKKIDDARTELAEMEQPDSYVLTRNTNIGYACYESDSNIVAGIANVFPVFFFLVAALICMTTMNRMVEEQRTQIGVLKALGYGNGAIMSKYLFYAGSAAAFGAVIGCIIGTWLFPKVIWTGYSIMYRMGGISYYFDTQIAVFSMLAALLCSMGAAYFSCRYELYSVPADLIRPKSPKSGKRIFLERITFLWSRMKFLHKVSIRNIIRYKKRFFMMILGISGCTALLVTGFGIKDSVTNVADMQFDEIQTYDIGITFSDCVHQAEITALQNETNQMLAQAACRYEESADLQFNGKIKSVYLEIPEHISAMEPFWHLHTQDKEPIPYPNQGEAVLSQKVAEAMGIRAGDTIVLLDNDRNELTCTVTALCENFVYNYAYISRETYQSQLGKEPEYKSAYATVSETVDVHEAAALIAGRDDVMAISVTSDMRGRIAGMMESMDYIVLLIIVCAGSLAFIVLYNLTNINITERIREIATIKVLGFYARETADYVFRENLALTGMGAIVGLGLGKWLHWFVMEQVKIDMLSFKTFITPVSYLWSLLFTFVFALLVNGLMYFKLEKINMAESLKSIE